MTSIADNTTQIAIQIVSTDMRNVVLGFKIFLACFPAGISSAMVLSIARTMRLTTSSTESNLIIKWFYPPIIESYSIFTYNIRFVELVFALFLFLSGLKMGSGTNIIWFGVK